MRVQTPFLVSCLFLGVTQAAHASPLLSRDKAHTKCLITQVQMIGLETDEHHASVLAKARAKCLNFERELDQQAGSTRNYSERGGSWVGTSKDELVERSERAAVEVLLRARAKLARNR
jgi:hypothetical protein